MLVKYATLWSIHSAFFFSFFFGVVQAFKKAIILLHMLLSGIFRSNYAPFLGVKYASKRRLCS